MIREGENAKGLVGGCRMNPRIRALDRRGAMGRDRSGAQPSGRPGGVRVVVDRCGAHSWICTSQRPVGIVRVFCDFTVKPSPRSIVPLPTW